jgi:hypothetical protein
MPSLLTLVCRRWRRIALSTPRLWRYISIHYLKMPIVPLALQLKSSGTMLLDFHIMFRERDVLPPLWTSLLSAIASLKAHLHRCRFLDVHNNSALILETLFPLGTHTDMPFLQRLHLEHHGYDFMPESLHIGTVHSPSLESIRPIDPTVFARPLASSFRFIRNLRIRQSRDFPEEFTSMKTSWSAPYKFVDLLESCVQLEVCEVRFQRGDIILAPQRSISLPVLRSLHLCFDDRFDPVSLLQGLYAPALQQLSLRNVGSNRAILPLDLFPTITASDLQQLSLSGFEFDRTIFLRLLSSLTTLRWLRLERLDLPDRIFEALTPGRDEPPGTWLCPQLQRLDLSKSNFSALSLLQLLDQRAPPNNHAVNTDEGTQFLDEIILSEESEHWLQSIAQESEPSKEARCRHKCLRVITEPGQYQRWDNEWE